MTIDTGSANLRGRGAYHECTRVKKMKTKSRQGTAQDPRHGLGAIEKERTRTEGSGIRSQSEFCLPIDQHGSCRPCIQD